MDSNITGYKAFYKGLVNNHGIVFEVGKKYTVEDEYKNYRYHFCKNIEDVFIYYRNIDIEICEVIGSGEFFYYYNDYYGVYDVYASSKLEIVRKIDREELINMMLDIDINRVIRFISLCKLSQDEIKLFEDKYARYDSVIDAINYYQKKDINVYKKKLNKY